MKLLLRRLLPTLLVSLLGLLASTSVLIRDALADGPLLVVNLAGKFKPCPGAPSGCERILLRGDPQSEPFHIVYRFPKGWMFPKHWHVSAENLVMVRGLLTINSEGGREQSLKAGDYLYIPANPVHWGACAEECVFYLGLDGPDSFNVVEEK